MVVSRHPKLFHLILIGILFLAGNALIDDEFNEELFIKPLQKGYVYSNFQFTTKWNATIHHTDTCEFSLYGRIQNESLV